MNRKELERKNKTELIALGVSLGFQFTPAMSQAEMVDSLSGAPEHAATAAAPVQVQEEGALPAEGKLRDLQGNEVKCRMYKVTIMATEQDKDPAKLSVNGHMMLVRRGVEVILAEPYVECLKAAVVNTVEKHPETEKMHAVQIQRYPFMAMPV